MTDEAKVATLPVGVVVEARPGVTRWAKTVHVPVAVLPGAGPADWRLLRDEGATRQYHAATLALTLHRADAEAYRTALAMTPPSVFVVLREGEGPHGVDVHTVTASPFEAQDYGDPGDEVVEPVPMPEGLVAFVRDFCDRHFTDVPFVKRQRDRGRIGPREDGIGDARVRQTADVYRVPHQQKARRDA
ncbi:MAG: DUF3305 domain-containing protein [Pseudomonadota bacterium]